MAAEGQVYRPPKLNPVSMETDPDKDYGKKERRKQQHAARKAGRSEFVQALAAELEGAPEEVCTHAEQLYLCLMYGAGRTLALVVSPAPDLSDDGEF